MLCVYLCICMFVHICRPKCMYVNVYCGCVYMCIYLYIFVTLSVYLYMYNGVYVPIPIVKYTIFLMCMHLACMYSYSEKKYILYYFWDINLFPSFNLYTVHII